MVGVNLGLASVIAIWRNNTPIRRLDSNFSSFPSEPYRHAPDKVTKRCAPACAGPPAHAHLQVKVAPVAEASSASGASDPSTAPAFLLSSQIITSLVCGAVLHEHAFYVLISQNGAAAEGPQARQITEPR